MKKMKRFLCFFMVMVMVLSMTACGGEKKKGKDTEEEFKVSDIYEAIEKGSTYTKGSYKMNVDMELAGTDDDVTMSIVSEGKSNGKDSEVGMLLDIAADGTEMSIDLSDFMVAADGNMYLNFDSVIKGLSGVDTELGYYGIPLPEETKTDNSEMIKYANGMIKAFFVNTEAKQDGNTFTLKLETAEDYEKGVKALVSYIDENRDAIEEAYKASANSVDVKAWLKKVIESMSEDLIAVSDLAGLGLTQDTIDEIVASVDEMDLNETDIDLFEGFDEVVASVEELTVEDFETMLAEGKMVTEFSVTITEDDFSMNLSLDAEVEGETLTADINYDFKGDKDVKVSAPEKVSTLVDMYKYLEENPDVIADVTEGLSELTGGMDIGQGSEAGAVDDDYTYDDEYTSDETVQNPCTFAIGNGVLSVSYDEAVLEAYSADQEIFTVDFLANDDSYSEIGVMAWEEDDAKAIYEFSKEFYTEYEYTFVSEGEVTLNGLSGYYLEMETDDENYKEVAYFLDVEGLEGCVEVDLYYYTDSNFTADELLAAVEIAYN